MRFELKEDKVGFPLDGFRYGARYFTDSGIIGTKEFVYHYRIFDRYRRQVVSLAILADEKEAWRPVEFSYGRWGCEMQFRFPVIKLLDFR
ncbi:MAG TPA: hypothetical protein HPP58_04415, partial [Deltaproteobacteria bacterium]|nr:hypothetical protein [Deltaproteobacteria bacterium]